MRCRATASASSAQSAEESWRFKALRHLPYQDMGPSGKKWRQTLRESCSGTWGLLRSAVSRRSIGSTRGGVLATVNSIEDGIQSRAMSMPSRELSLTVHVS